MKKTNLYLSYGSNLNLLQMRYRCPGAEIVGYTQIENYQILFRGSPGGAVATIEKKEGFHVPVAVWKISNENEKRLDRYEGFPIFYRKEYFNINLDGKTKKCMIYIMNEGRQINLPSRYYFGTIWAGYKSAGFDEDILRQALKIK